MKETTLGMMLPDGLVWILDKLGFEWPDLDEDEIRRGAELLRQYGIDLGDVIDAVDQRMNLDIVGASQSQGVLAFADAWNQNRSQNLQKIVDAMDPAATGVDLAADAVLALKVKVIVDVTLTAAQVATALASSLVTFGAGAAVAAGLILARKAALNIAMDIAFEELMAQVLPLVITPMVEEIPSIADALLDSPIVTGTVGDLGQVRIDLDALDQAAEDMEAAATDLETVTSQFLASVRSLNIMGG